MSDARLAEILGHMAQAAALACSYVEGMTKEDFLADSRTQQAVVMNLIIIGEVAARMIQDHSAFIDASTEIPWRSMKGMRNRIAHGYFEIDLGIVWDTVQADLAPLVKLLAARGYV